MSDAESAFSRYLADIPLLHTWDDGKTWNTGGFGERELRYLFSCVGTYGTGGGRVVETGAGNSTISFLCASPVSVKSICVDDKVFDRVEAECAKRAIKATALTSFIGFSEDITPRIARDAIERQEFADVVLLDGGHGWPTCFVDFCYLYAMLRNGGVMILDDIQLYSVKELARFLSESFYFRKIDQMGKVLVFQKLTSDTRLPDFGGSPYIMRRTKEDADAGQAYTL